MRKGVCNARLAHDPDTGQRHVQVTAPRTKAGYARFVDGVVATHYPDVPTSKLVQNTYSTHAYGTFYGPLPVARARQRRHQLAFHFAFTRGSSLNRTEIEFSALSRQCLDRRIDSAQQPEEEALI